jgi:hypothetical protein
MASNVFSLSVTGGPSMTFTSGNHRDNLRKVSNRLRRLEGGNQQGAVTLNLRSGEAFATGTVTAASVAAADTITINGTALTAEQQRATATATFSSLADADTVTLGGFVMTAKTAVTDATTQFALGANDTAAAANCAALVNATTNAGVYGLVTATSAAGVVTFRAVTAGTAGNAITLVSSNGTRAAVTGSGTLANGTAPTNNKFDVSPGSTNTQVGDDIVRCILASSTALISGTVLPTNASGVVTLTALKAGYLGNAITLASSNSGRLAVSGARLTGGAETLLSVTL